MRVSALEEYGLRCLVQLARGGTGPDSGVTLAAREIAEREGLGLEYTAQILTALRKGGLVTSVRGVNGGFRLARPAAAISVGEMFRALDGQFAQDLCDQFTGRLDTCANAGDCNVAPVWSELSRRMYGYLDSVSLADIATGNVQRQAQLVPLSTLKPRS